MAELSLGKDTPTGHWEMVGVETTEPFAVYNPQFPDAIIAEFTALTGYEVLGNVVASGTQILDEDRETLIAYLRTAGEQDKGDIARAFGLKGEGRRALRDMLRKLG